MDLALTDGDAEDVRLQLHQQPVGRHAAVHLELGERDAAVLVHGVQNLAGESPSYGARSHKITNVLRSSVESVKSRWLVPQLIVKVFETLLFVTTVERKMEGYDTLQSMEGNGVRVGDLPLESGNKLLPGRQMRDDSCW